MFDLEELVKKILGRIVERIPKHYLTKRGSFKVIINREQEVFITAILEERSSQVTIKAVRHCETTYSGWKRKKRAYYLMTCSLSEGCDNDTVRALSKTPVKIPTDYSLWMPPTKHLECAITLYIDYLKNECGKR